MCHAGCLGGLSGVCRAICLCPTRVHDLLPNSVRDPVPERPWAGFAIRQPLIALLLALLPPAVESAAGHVQLSSVFVIDRSECSTRWMISRGECRIIRPTSCPCQASFFFQHLILPEGHRDDVSASSATRCLPVLADRPGSCSFSFRRASAVSLLAWRLVSPIRRAFPASRNSLLQR